MEESPTEASYTEQTLLYNVLWLLETAIPLVVRAKYFRGEGISEYGLTSHPTHNSAFRGRFLYAT